MIYSLRGTLLCADATSFVVECGGVGYRCLAPLGTLSALPPIGKEMFCYTFMNVREDAVELFGFSTEEELNCFKLITSVSGVGPKIGLALLSEFPPDKLMLYVASGDYKMLTAASGVGAKLAQRMVLELKDKAGNGLFGSSETIASVGNAVSASNTGDAVAALVSFGYSQSEAALAVGRLDPNLPTDELIKLALTSLSRMV